MSLATSSLWCLTLRKVQVPHKYLVLIFTILTMVQNVISQFKGKIKKKRYWVYVHELKQLLELSF